MAEARGFLGACLVKRYRYYSAMNGRVPIPHFKPPPRGLRNCATDEQMDAWMQHAMPEPLLINGSEYRRRQRRRRR